MDPHHTLRAKKSSPTKLKNWLMLKQVIEAEFNVYPVPSGANRIEPGAALEPPLNNLKRIIE